MSMLIALLGMLFQQTVSLGAIEGNMRLLSTGAPVAGIEVKMVANGETRETVTDGAGHFVFAGVPPGQLSLEARADGYLFPQRLSGGATAYRTANGYVPANAVLRSNVTLAPDERLKLPAIDVLSAASIRGHLVDSKGNSVPGATVAIIVEFPTSTGGAPIRMVAVSAQTDDRGEYKQEMLSPGTYILQASVDRPGVAHLTVYYPATTDPLTAAPVVLSEGAQGIADIEIPAKLETFGISGVVRPPAGQSQSDAVGVLLKTVGQRPVVVADTSTDEKSGRFELRGIPGGRYELFASVEDYLGKTTVEIRGRDVENIELQLQPGADVRGRLLIDGDGDLLLARTRSADGIKVTLNRADHLLGDIRPVIDASGKTFAFEHVPPGEYTVGVAFQESRDQNRTDLYVADVRANGRSVLDNGLIVGVDPSDNLEVVIGTRGASIRGTVTGGKPKQPTTVVLIPAAARRNNASLVRAAAVSADSGFELRGLAPGTYRIFAVQEVIPLSEEIPDLSAYELRAITMVIEKGAALTGVQVPVVVGR